jgi:uncharacterized protein HemX
LNLEAASRVKPQRQPEGAPMSRNSLYAVIALLAVVIVGFVIWYLYQEQQKPALEIKVNEQGISIDGKG